LLQYQKLAEEGGRRREEEGGWSEERRLWQTMTEEVAGMASREDRIDEFNLGKSSLVSI
jgi:hypothetical protein